MAMLIPADTQNKEYRYRRSLIPHMDACFALHENGIFHLCKVDPGLANLCSAYARVSCAIYSEHGQPGKAPRLIEKVVDMQKQTFGGENSLTLESLGYLARSYSRVDREVEALQLRKRLLEMSKHTLGEKDPVTLTSMANLASSYSSLNQHEEQLRLMEVVVETAKRTLAEEHVFTFNMTLSLALIYCMSGRYREAWIQ
ncbi:hypothetical protein EPUS_09280 [Endocarpon pusillum Z07020]|uniref:MalT-like TPR region domain-containing protein n=1 Tax=Endocarpon pusillum (strain Z07020 / HMAS-L-300199) TaxID=1263415 RepID=U1GUS8_ENDPU|nr:uncharacterized protein EPUS_09280 [Endocarpon pusillum Z07020]ERF76213.1 hypothetical protein EPUS_09280 [Endocarpon pusillum Z07020]